MEIVWEKIGEDDFKAIPEEGWLLRVEKMCFNCYWWAVHPKDWNGLDSDTDGGFRKTEKGAKEKCIEAYKKLKDEQNTNKM